MDLARHGPRTILLAKCPPGTTIPAAIQSGLISPTDVIEAPKALPSNEQWDGQTDILELVEAADDKTGAVVHALVEHVKESSAYEAHMSSKQLRKQYKDIFKRSEDYRITRDKNDERKRKIMQHWTEPWILAWLNDYYNTRLIQESISEVAKTCDFGTAVLLANEAALTRLHGRRGPGKRTIEVRPQDWNTVAKHIREGSHRPAVTEDTVLAARGARLGQYYLIEADVGAPSPTLPCCLEGCRRCEPEAGRWLPEGAVTHDRDPTHSLALPGLGC